MAPAVVIAVAVAPVSHYTAPEARETAAAVEAASDLASAAFVAGAAGCAPPVVPADPFLTAPAAGLPSAAGTGRLNGRSPSQPVLAFCWRPYRNDLMDTEIEKLYEIVAVWIEVSVRVLCELCQSV